MHRADAPADQAPVSRAAADGSHDAVLVARVRAGDVAAFEGIVRRHMRSAFGIAYHVLQHREDAEDAVQQAFMTALARLETYDSSRPFSPWFGRLVLNHARNARRVRQRVAQRWTESVDTIAAPAVGRPDRSAEDAEARECVRAAVAILPERQRLAVQFIDIEGYSPAEVAGIMEISPVTVRWHLMAARRRLRRLLAPLVETGRCAPADGPRRRPDDARAGRPPAQGQTEDGNATHT